MKKRLRHFLLPLLLFLLILPFTASAPVRAMGESTHIYDRAMLFSMATHNSLERKMAEMEQKYGTKIVILTTYQLTDSQLSGEYTGIRAFTEDFYDYVICGGVETSGIILGIDMMNRKMWVSTTGEEIARFENDLDYLLDKVAACLSDYDNDSAAETFVKLVDQKHRLGFYPPGAGKIILSLAIGALVGLIVVGVLKSQLKTVYQATSARNYAVPGSFKLRRVNELYLYSSVTQVPKAPPAEKSDGFGGGFGSFGGGGSSGFSHGGGGRTF